MAQIVRLDPIYAISHVGRQAYNIFMRVQQHSKATQGEGGGLDMQIELVDGEIYPHMGEFMGSGFRATAASSSIGAWIEFPPPLLPGENVTIRGRDRIGVEIVLVPQRRRAASTGSLPADGRR